MKISRAWSLLVAMGFIVAITGGVPKSELSDLQKKAMNLTTENFYKIHKPKKHFIVTSILEASQEVSTTQGIGSSNLKDHLITCSSHFTESSENAKVQYKLLLIVLDVEHSTIRLYCK